jgi:hypothetical protein
MPSERFINAITAQETAELPVVLVTITHADFTAPLQWCTGGADIVQDEGGGGEKTFTARAMKVALPGEGAEAGSRRARLMVDNIEQDAIAELRSVQLGRPIVLLEVVLADYPDDVEISWPGLQVIAARPQSDAIEIELSPRDDSEEEWPVQSFSQGRVPGLF